MLKPIILAAALAAATQAGAVTIDFSTFAQGASVTSVDGVTFEMTDGNAPTVQFPFGYEPYGLALVNSLTDNYPTTSGIVIDFGAAVSGIAFTFNNFGTGNGSAWSTFDAADNLLDSGDLSSVSSFDSYLPVAVGGAGVRKLVVTNGDSPFWLYGIGELSFDGSGVVPEPATWAMMILGFGLVGAAARRRTTTVNA